MSSDIQAHLDAILAHAKNPSSGLPQEVFYFVSQLTPMVNVDLLIRAPQGQTLLTWRSDQFYGPGWHLPGGIIRFKELAHQRIAAVAESELGAKVQAAEKPLAFFEKMAPNRNVRGHFIAFLYECKLLSVPCPSKAFTPDNPQNGQWAWFSRCPENLISAQECFRSYIDHL